MKLLYTALIATAVGQNIANEAGNDTGTVEATAAYDDYYYEYYDSVDELGRGKRRKKKDKNKKKKKNENDSAANYGNPTTSTTTTTTRSLPPYAGTTKATTEETTTEKATTEKVTTEKATTTEETKRTAKTPKPTYNPYAPTPNGTNDPYNPISPKYPTPPSGGGGNAQDDNPDGLQCYHCDAPSFEECYKIGKLKPCQENAGACMIEIRKRSGKMESVCMGCKQKRACIDNKKQNFVGPMWQCRPKAMYGPSVCRQCCNTDECTRDFDPPNYQGWNENLLV